MTSPVYTDLVTGEVSSTPLRPSYPHRGQDKPRHTPYELERLRRRHRRPQRHSWPVITLLAHVALAAVLVLALATR